MCGDNLHIYSGNDDQAIPICSLGGLGVISVLSNIKPKFTHDMVWNFLNGNLEVAKNMQLESIPLINDLFAKVNPIPVKAALNKIGYNVGGCRLPIVSLDKNEENELFKKLKI